jgi:fibronectin type 3 domain-containing protein
VVLLTNVKADTLSYNDTSVTNGIIYVYVVKAVNTAGSSPSSNAATAIPSVVGTAPGAPTALVANGSKNKISLSWTAPADPGSGIFNYLVYRGTTAGSGGILIATVTGTTFMDNNVTSGTPYYYLVKANNTYGASPISNEATGTAAVPTVPSAPQNLTVTLGVNKVTLTWTAPSDDGGSNILSYSIYRNSAGGAFSRIGSVPAGTLSYVDMNGTAGSSYYVVAVNSLGSGTQSTTLPTSSDKNSGGFSGSIVFYAEIGIVIAAVLVVGVYVFIRRRKK